jgi:transcriptional regulator with XRE-family HTH domain
MISAVAIPRSARHRAFGEALRELRGAAGYSQESLADAAKLDRTYVSGIERGERNPSLTNLFRLADTLGVQLSERLVRAEQKLP